MSFIDAILISIIGVIEGVTEWLPVSSTGHMMIFEHFFSRFFSDEFRVVFENGFKDMFDYLIQLGAILAVVVVFWKRIFPFAVEKKQVVLNGQTIEKRKVVSKPDVWSMWFKVVVACVPAFAAIFVDKLFDRLDDVAEIVVVGSTLVIYGILFIVVENLRKGKEPRTNSVGEITYLDAFLIGCFQALAAVPGTSRSGVTIIGALILGLSRPTAAEFTFFLAIPTMVGASGYKILKYVKNGFSLGGSEVFALVLGMAVAFVVSLFVIEFLMNFVRKRDFKPFGYYRIVLGILTIVLCLGIS